MPDAKVFFDQVRASFGTLKQSQIDGFNAVLSAIDGAPISHQAYMLATAWHETNGTMQPVREAYWLSEDWRRMHLRYYPYYGRGYVQLTWASGYKRAGEELGLGADLAHSPDRAMEPEIAAKIMRRGMDEGWFTGKKLADYLPADLDAIATDEQFEAARRIINGTDRAHTVAAYALNFQRATDAAA